MGVQVNVGAIEQAANELTSLEGQILPAIPPPPQMGGGPLSRGLATAHNEKKDDANTFVTNRNSGLAAAGEGLRHIAGHFNDFDQQSANAIRSLFPAAPPDPNGGQ